MKAGSKASVMDGSLWEEYRLQDLMRRFIDNRLIIVAVALTMSALLFLLTFFLEKTYMTKIVMAPSVSSQAGSLSQLSGRVSGIASLVGISLPGVDSLKEDVALEMLRSPGFIYEFSKKNELIVPLFAGKYWNFETKELVIDDSVYSVKSGEWKRFSLFGLVSRVVEEPTPNDVYKKFSSKLSIRRDDRIGFVYLGLEHISPELSSEWLLSLVEYLNEEYRRKDSEELQRNLDYLYNKAAETSLKEMKSVFYSLIEEQTKLLLIANSNKDYVFSIIGTPIPPDVNDENYPRKLIFLVCGLLLGVVLSLVYLTVTWLPARQ